MLTFDLIQGRKIPIVKMPKSGPFVIASRLIVNCKTVPIFSTTYTKATQITPTTTTTDLIIQLICLTLSGDFTNVLKKSSNTTADNEFKHVDKELNAAEKTPAMNNPERPGN